MKEDNSPIGSKLDQNYNNFNIWYCVNAIVFQNIWETDVKI